MFRFRSFVVSMIVLTAVALYCLPIAFAGDAPAAKPAVTKTWTAGVVPPSSPAPPVAAPDPEKKAGRLGIIERRKLGLTIGNILPIAKRLEAEGKIDKDNPEESATLIYQELVKQNPRAFADPQLDLDGILAFIEKLMPLIMQLIAIFSA